MPVVPIFCTVFTIAVINVFNVVPEVDDAVSIGFSVWFATIVCGAAVVWFATAVCGAAVVWFATIVCGKAVVSFATIVCGAAVVSFATTVCGAAVLWFATIVCGAAVVWFATIVCGEAVVWFATIVKLTWALTEELNKRNKAKLKGIQIVLYDGIIIYITLTYVKLASTL